MAWSWSHTDEGIRGAYLSVFLIPRDVLVEILAEWRMHERGFSDDDWQREYPAIRNLIRYHRYPHLTLVNSVWRRAREFATCDNGGFNAWLCPYGCDVHKVPFGCDELRIPDELTI